MARTKYYICVDCSSDRLKGAQETSAEKLVFSTFSDAIKHCAVNGIWSRAQRFNDTSYIPNHYDTETTGQNDKIVYITSSQGKRWRVNYPQPKDLLKYTPVEPVQQEDNE